MKTIILTLLLLTSLSSFGASGPNKHIYWLKINQLDVELRAGVFEEQSKLKACVLYLQGLGDSMLNHKPYFSKLSEAGYRVITFDYMGQGGSSGSMNDTRVEVKLPQNPTIVMQKKYDEKLKYKEISTQAKLVWDRFGKFKNKMGVDCSNSKKLLIGWSTGGLAGYKMARDLEIDAVVLIAPGINPKLMVGESSDSWYEMLLFQETITERTLTRNKFLNGMNPHVEEIKPTSPMHVPQFSGNLILTAASAQHWRVSQRVPGLVFLSGVEDTYVNREDTLDTLSQNAAHFQTILYDEALHEIDNEVDSISGDLHWRTINFFDELVENQ